MLRKDLLALWKLAIRSDREVLRLWDIRPLNNACSWWKVSLVQHLNSLRSSLFLLDTSLGISVIPVGDAVVHLRWIVSKLMPQFCPNGSAKLIPGASAMPRYLEPL
jgi:hypothetical protein